MDAHSASPWMMARCGQSSATCRTAARAARPRPVRQTDDCLQCHASAMTLGVPGLMVRSVYASAAGTPILSAGSFRTTSQSPLAERWGGWYVTGTHGRQLHMGNNVLRGTEESEQFDRHEGANVTELAKRFDVKPYLTPQSDIVAVPVDVLSRGAYELSLAGLTADGRREEVATFTFEVTTNGSSR